jgi:hypothetical protein
LYFSAGSYSTVGCGDLLLPRTWRLLGVVESGTGALMGGISAGFIFAAMMRLLEREAHFSPELEWVLDKRHRQQGDIAPRLSDAPKEVEKGRQ